MAEAIKLSNSFRTDAPAPPRSCRRVADWRSTLVPGAELRPIDPCWPSGPSRPGAKSVRGRIWTDTPPRATSAHLLGNWSATAELDDTAGIVGLSMAIGMIRLASASRRMGWTQCSGTAVCLETGGAFGELAPLVVITASLRLSTVEVRRWDSCNFGRIRAKHGPNLANSGRNRLHFFESGPTCSQLWPSSADTAQIWPTPDQVWPDSLANCVRIRAVSLLLPSSLEIATGPNLAKGGHSRSSSRKTRLLYADISPNLARFGRYHRAGGESGPKSAQTWRTLVDVDENSSCPGQLGPKSSRHPLVFVESEPSLAKFSPEHGNCRGNSNAKCWALCRRYMLVICWATPSFQRSHLRASVSNIVFRRSVVRCNALLAA